MLYSHTHVTPSLCEILVLGFMCNSTEHSIQIEYQINLKDSWRDWYKLATLTTCCYISPCTPTYSKRKRGNWVYSRKTFYNKNIKPLNFVPPKMSITKLSVLSSHFYCKNIKPLNFVPSKMLLTKLGVLSVGLSISVKTEQPLRTWMYVHQ